MSHFPTAHSQFFNNNVTNVPVDCITLVSGPNYSTSMRSIAQGSEQFFGCYSKIIFKNSVIAPQIFKPEKLHPIDILNPS